ncbi:MAG: flavin reductase family protein [Actinomycetota bacterium]|nr:flavin reductase family protein [Actinomycetota bacterium]
MKLELGNFYKILAPRPAVLISTIDARGRTNAAPFSFVMPVSRTPPLIAFALAPQRHTLANIRETREFVVNIAPEEILDELWICGKSFPKGVSEIRESGLTERKSKIVKAPGIEECIGWFECTLEFEKEAGDHVIVVGRVLNAEVKDEFFREGEFDLLKAKPLMHLGGENFAIPERIARPQKSK